MIKNQKLNKKILSIKKLNTYLNKLQKILVFTKNNKYSNSD